MLDSPCLSTKWECGGGTLNPLGFRGLRVGVKGFKGQRFRGYKGLGV